MHETIRQFETNLQRARQLGFIYQALREQVAPAVELDELLRGELVLSVSAVDCYVHDVVRRGMMTVFRLGRGEPNEYLNFQVSLGFVKRLLVADEDHERLACFEEEVRRLQVYRTFQSADNISQALSLIGVQAVWELVAQRLGTAPSDVKTRLNLVVERRNRIAHESDIDPTLGIGDKFPIDYHMVEEAVDFLDAVVHALHDTVTATAHA
ncbi:MAG: HEPN domain-containing protein [Thermodesulfobacteriota bacterium]